MSHSSFISYSEGRHHAKPTRRGRNPSVDDKAEVDDAELAGSWIFTALALLRGAQ